MKHDYNSEEFYQEVWGYAFQGANDAEIADFLDMTPEEFNHLKNGTVAAWDDIENQRVSKKIKQVLTRARRKVNFVVRGRYLKAALGGIKIKSKTTVRRKLRLDGQYTDDEDIQTTEQEHETAPNINALATWLYHHDADWRKIQRGLDTEDDTIQNVDTGIDIQKWITQELNAND